MHSKLTTAYHAPSSQFTLPSLSLPPCPSYIMKDVAVKEKAEHAVWTLSSNIKSEQEGPLQEMQFNPF